MIDSGPIQRDAKMSAARIFTLGCGGLILAGVIIAIASMLWLIPKAKSALNINPARISAEALIEAHPDLRTVSTDEQSRQITLTQSGKENTLSFEAIADGTFLPPSPEATPPQWLESAVRKAIPSYRVVFEKNSGSGTEGAVIARQATDPKEVYDNLKQDLEEQGFEFNSSASVNINNTYKGFFTGTSGDRTVKATITAAPAENARVLIYYKERR